MHSCILCPFPTQSHISWLYPTHPYTFCYILTHSYSTYLFSQTPSLLCPFPLQIHTPCSFPSILCSFYTHPYTLQKYTLHILKLSLTIVFLSLKEYIKMIQFIPAYRISKWYSKYARICCIKNMINVYIVFIFPGDYHSSQIYSILAYESCEVLISVSCTHDDGKRTRKRRVVRKRRVERK